MRAAVVLAALAIEAERVVKLLVLLPCWKVQPITFLSVLGGTEGGIIQPLLTAASEGVLAEAGPALVATEVRFLLAAAAAALMVRRAAVEAA